MAEPTPHDAQRAVADVCPVCDQPILDDDRHAGEGDDVHGACCPCNT